MSHRFMHSLDGTRMMSWLERVEKAIGCGKSGCIALGIGYEYWP